MTDAPPPEHEWRTEDGILCFECGEWKKALGAHLRLTHEMSVADYRAKWGMTQRQPLVSRAVSEHRRQVAIRTGGPERMREWLPVIAPVAHAAARDREVRPQERQKWVDGSRRGAATRSAAAADRLDRADAVIAADGFAGRREWLAARYWDAGWSISECASALGLSSGHIKEWMEVAGIRTRKSGPRGMKKRDD